MRIWTIQPVELYRKLESKGVLLADGRRCDRYFRAAYQWMTAQMRHRLPPSRGRFPWWGWCRYEKHRAKPDLRAGGYLRKGQQGARIELELADDEVLLSDFNDWHYVLNGWFLADNEAEDGRFEQELEELGHKLFDPYPEFVRAKILASWERIFELRGGDPVWGTRPLRQSTQATFWELRLKDVTDVTFFTDRGSGF